MPGPVAAPKGRDYIIQDADGLPGRRADIKKSLPESGVIHARSYRAPNWFTSEGVNKKRAALEKKGLPSFLDWRFLTFTIDRELFDSPLEAFLAGRKQLASFFRAARRHNVFPPGTRYLWKLEFHKDGWPHWHALVEHLDKFPVETLRTISELWGLGRTNVERVVEDDFLYSFKYAFKPVLVEGQDSLEGGQAFVLPDWFLDYFEPGKDGKKPKTFSRIRFFQTSPGFFGKSKPAPEKKPKRSSLVPAPVREVAARYHSQVQVIARHRTGRYVASAVILLSCTFAHLVNRAAFATLHGHSVFLEPNSFVLPIQELTRNTENKCHLLPLLQKNRLTLKAAESLRNRGETLRTC